MIEEATDLGVENADELTALGHFKPQKFLNGEREGVLGGSCAYSCLNIVGGPTMSLTYDYNCDNVDTRRYTRTNVTTCSSATFPAFGCTSAGWTGSTGRCWFRLSRRS